MTNMSVCCWKQNKSSFHVPTHLGPVQGGFGSYQTCWTQWHHPKNYGTPLSGSKIIKHAKLISRCLIPQKWKRTHDPLNHVFGTHPLCFWVISNMLNTMVPFKKLWDQYKWVPQCQTCLFVAKNKTSPLFTHPLIWDPFTMLSGHIKYGEHNGIIQKIMAPL